jgi:hypothetical protein
MTTQATHKAGTRIEVSGFAMDWSRTWEPAKICRPTKVNLPMPGPGWHIIQYADGGKMCCHESNFRVVSNR